MHLVLPEITSVGEVDGFFLHLVLLVLCVGLGGNCDIVVVVVVVAASSSGMPAEFVVQLLLRIGGVGGGSEVDGEGSGGGDGGVVVHDGWGGWGVFVLAVELGEVLRLELEMSLIPVCLTYILMRKV